MRKKSEFHQALQLFTKEIGVLVSLICDPSEEQSCNQVKQFSKECQMKLKLLEEFTQWANLAERYIGILKSAVRKDMYKSNCPLRFWNYCVEWKVCVQNLTAKDRLALDGTNPYTATFGEESDISNICNFGFYELVYYWENTNSFPKLKKKIG